MSSRTVYGACLRILASAFRVGLFCAFAGCTPQAPVQQKSAPHPDDEILVVYSEERELVRSEPSLDGHFTRLLDVELADRGEVYKAAVEDVLCRQIAFCAGKGDVDQVQVSWTNEENTDVTVSLSSPVGHYGYGDTHSKAITIRDGAVVDLTFRIDTIIDSCPCHLPEDADYLDDRVLETISAIDSLRSIELINSEISDVGLESLGRLRDLRSVNLERSAVTCEGLQHLGSLDKLETLRITGKNQTRFPPDLCNLIARHKRLRELYMGAVELDRAAVAALASCPELEDLTIGIKRLERGAFRALQGNGCLKSLNVSVTCEDAGPISLQKMTQLSNLVLYARGAHIELLITDLPKLRRLGMRVKPTQSDAASGKQKAAAPRVTISDLVALEQASIALGAPRIADSPESRLVSLRLLPPRDGAAIDEEKAGAPRVTIGDLVALEHASIALGPPRIADPPECGIVQLKHLPSLTWASLGSFAGRLEVDGQLPNLKGLTVYGASFPAHLFRALPHLPNLQRFELHAPPRSDQGLHPTVSLKEMAPLFDLKDMQTLHLASICDDELSFGPFLELPRLTELTFEDCEMSELFEAAGHAELTHLRFEEASPRQIVVRDMPKLRKFEVIRASQFRAAEMIECPSLEACWCGPASATVDLRQAKLQSPEKLRESIRRGLSAVLLPETAE